MKALFFLLLPLISSPSFSCQNPLTLKDLNAPLFKGDTLKEDMLTSWHPVQGTPRGSVLIFHGLNANPSKMKDFIGEFNRLNFDVMNGALYGHRGVLREMRTLSYAKLYEHARQHFCSFLNRAGDGPVILFGYSMGAVLQGLLFYEFYQQIKGRVKIVWVAPAFEITRWASASRMLKGKRLLFSIGPTAYKANEGTSFNGYRSLHDARREFQNHFHGNSSLLPPSLIFVNREDELIHFKKTKKLFSSLDQVKLEMVNNESSTLEKTFNHLMVDRQSLGEEGWALVTQSIENFLAL